MKTRKTLGVVVNLSYGLVDNSQLLFYLLIDAAHSFFFKCRFFFLNSEVNEQKLGSFLQDDFLTILSLAGPRPFRALEFS